MKTEEVSKTPYQKILELLIALAEEIHSVGSNSKIYLLIQILIDTIKSKKDFTESNYPIMLMHSLRETHALLTSKNFPLPAIDTFNKIGMAAFYSNAEEEQKVIELLEDRLNTLIKNDNGLRAYIIRGTKLSTHSYNNFLIAENSDTPSFVDPEKAFFVDLDNADFKTVVENAIDEYYKLQSCTERRELMVWTATKRNYVVSLPEQPNKFYVVESTLFAPDPQKKSYLMIQVSEQERK